MKFISVPTEIDAMQFDGENADHIFNWVETLTNDAPCMTYDKSIWIETLEGTMRADKGDWIICGTMGEFYPCKDEAFKRKYKAVK